MPNSWTASPSSFIYWALFIWHSNEHIPLPHTMMQVSDVWWGWGGNPGDMAWCDDREAISVPVQSQWKQSCHCYSSNLLERLRLAAVTSLPPLWLCNLSETGWNVCIIQGEAELSFLQALSVCDTVLIGGTWDLELFSLEQDRIGGGSDSPCLPWLHILGTDALKEIWLYNLVFLLMKVSCTYWGLCVELMHVCGNVERGMLNPPPLQEWYQSAEWMNVV